MVNDQEPRYRLVDADGNVVGSFFAESDGTLKLQEGTSGNDNELSLGTDGDVSVEKVTSTGRITTREAGDKAVRSVGNGFVGATVEAYRDSPSDKAILNLFGARGTESSPAAIQNDDTISSIFTRGNIGTGFTITTKVRVRASEDFTDTSSGSEIVFDTTPNGTNASDIAFVADADYGIQTVPKGSASEPAIQIGNGGAGLFVDGSGEVVVVNEAGTTTTIS